MRRLLHAVVLLTLVALLAGTQCSAQCLASGCNADMNACPHSHGKSHSDCTHKHLQISKVDRVPDLLPMMVPGLATVPHVDFMPLLPVAAPLNGNLSPPGSGPASLFSILRI
ncbi:MAG TPA: hypothetical protein VFB14_16925 [Bryobacteraceae bacterium]|nr:hypothetical protein [Bryobacteraceae bacterium]